MYFNLIVQPLETRSQFQTCLPGISEMVAWESPIFAVSEINPVSFYAFCSVYSLVKRHLFRSNGRCWLFRAQLKLSNGKDVKLYQTSSFPLNCMCPHAVLAAAYWHCHAEKEKAVIWSLVQVQGFFLTWVGRALFACLFFKLQCRPQKEVVDAASCRKEKGTWGLEELMVRAGQGVNYTCKSVSAVHNKRRLPFQVL